MAIIDRYHCSQIVMPHLTYLVSVVPSFDVETFRNFKGLCYQSDSFSG